MPVVVTTAPRRVDPPLAASRDLEDSGKSPKALDGVSVYDTPRNTGADQDVRGSQDAPMSDRATDEARKNLGLNTESDSTSADTTMNVSERGEDVGADIVKVTTAAGMKNWTNVWNDAKSQLSKKEVEIAIDEVDDIIELLPQDVRDRNKDKDGRPHVYLEDCFIFSIKRATGKIENIMLVAE